MDERTDGLWLVGDGFELALSDPHQANLESWDGDRDRLVLGVRPEDLQDASLLDSAEWSDDETIQARIEVVEPMGAHENLTLTLAEGEDRDAVDDEEREFTARVGNDSDARAGDLLTLVVDVAEAHVFDRDTGENVTV